VSEANNAVFSSTKGCVAIKGNLSSWESIMFRLFKERKAPNFLIQYKKIAYVFSLIPAMVIFLLPHFTQWLNSVNLAIITGFIIFFVLIPLADYFIGRDQTNPTPEQASVWAEEKFYRYLTYLMIPAQMAVIFTGGQYFIEHDLTSGQLIGLSILIGVVTATLGITTGHELVHKTTKLEQILGGILYSTVCYGGFKVEHVRGHHVNVSTEKDPSSAEYNQTLYHFLPRAMRHNTLAAFRLEASRLKAKGLSAWHYRNELLYWYGLSVVWFSICCVLWGLQGGVYFLLQAFAAAVVLETINYVEHYGLRRKLQEEGGFEKVMPHHSWNNDYLLSNLLLFQLQRHADHHYRAAKRYQVLINHAALPQLPLGYPIMLLMAFVPPLWFWVMNPRVEQMEAYAASLQSS